MKSVLKKVYQIIPFKKQLFIGLKKIWRPSERIFKHLYFNGVIKIKVSDGVDFKMNHYGYQLENEIFWVGLTEGWEKESIKLWIKLCEGSEVIFDIGANTGLYALVAKAISPQAQVYAFEPMSNIFSRLQENARLNNFEIMAYDKAVSDSDGTAAIYPTNTDHVYSVTVNKNLSKPEERVFETRIETIRLDTLIKMKGISKIDLMKIDVETHEPEVLKGFSEYLLKFRPTLLIEILTDEIGVQINDMVKDLGYLYFNIDEKGKVWKVDKLTKSAYYNFLFCSPEVAQKIGLLSAV